MQIARILFPIQTLGPGNRICIWVCGCRRHCFQCANPELQAFDSTKDVPFEALCEMLSPILSVADGVTISGGEPFEQTAELRQLVDFISPLIKDILIFSGYTKEELYARNDFNTNRILSSVAVLIDGEYIDKLNQGDALRGSSNQHIHYLNTTIKSRYEDYLQEGRKVQNIATCSGVFSIGIHNKGFVSDLKTGLSFLASLNTE